MVYLFYYYASSSLSDSPSPSSIHVDSTTSFTRLLYSLLFSINNLAASELAGLLGLGSDRRD